MLGAHREFPPVVGSLSEGTLAEIAALPAAAQEELMKLADEVSAAMAAPAPSLALRHRTPRLVNLEEREVVRVPHEKLLVCLAALFALVRRREQR